MEWPDGIDRAEALRIVTDLSRVVEVGCEVLDHDEVVQDDVGETLRVEGSQVTHEYDVDIHGACRLLLSHRLDWPQVWLRPWMAITADAGGTVRRELGVYRPLRPTRTAHQDLEVAGLDLCSRLAYPHGETVVLDVDEPYLDAAVELAAERGVTLQVDGTGDGKVAPRPRWWSLETTTLEIVGDLLAEGGFMRPYADHRRLILRSGPELPIGDRPVEITYDTADPSTVPVAVPRTVDEGDGDVPNRLIAVTSTALSWEPVEGDGMRTLTAGADLARTGFLRPEVVRLDAADQEVLDTLAEAEFAKLRREETEVRIQTPPSPLAWHADVARYRDPELEVPELRTLATYWALDLDGSDMDVTLRTSA